MKPAKVKSEKELMEESLQRVQKKINRLSQKKTFGIVEQRVMDRLKVEEGLLRHNLKELA